MFTRTPNYNSKQPKRIKHTSQGLIEKAIERAKDGKYLGYKDYTYRVDLDTGFLYRCFTHEKDHTFIGSDGLVHDRWILMEVLDLDKY